MQHKKRDNVSKKKEKNCKRDKVPVLILKSQNITLFLRAISNH